MSQATTRVNLWHVDIANNWLDNMEGCSSINLLWESTFGINIMQWVWNESHNKEERDRVPRCSLRRQVQHKLLKAGNRRPIQLTAMLKNKSERIITYSIHKQWSERTMKGYESIIASINSWTEDQNPRKAICKNQVLFPFSFKFLLRLPFHSSFPFCSLFVWKGEASCFGNLT